MAEGTNAVLEPNDELTLKDIDFLEIAWVEPSEKFGETCAALFKPLFRDHPQYRELFSFKDVPDEDWLENKKFLIHCKRSIDGLTSAIDAIRNPDKLNTVLDKLRESHAKRNIKEKEFIHLRDAIIEGSVIFLNGEKEKIKVFTKAMHILTDKIVQGFNEPK